MNLSQKVQCWLKLKKIISCDNRPAIYKSASREKREGVSGATNNTFVSEQVNVQRADTMLL